MDYKTALLRLHEAQERLAAAERELDDALGDNALRKGQPVSAAGVEACLYFQAKAWNEVFHAKRQFAKVVERELHGAAN